MLSEPKRLPVIVCSSVIRASHRGDSHGGIYKIDLETGKKEMILDWDRPDIDWEGRGGDRGVRGMSFYKGLMYAAAGNELFVFDKDMDVVKSFTNQWLRHTHEIWRDGSLLYIIANMFDTILVFDLDNDKWVDSWKFIPDKKVAIKFDPNRPANPIYTDKLHLDSVLVKNNIMYYCGAHMRSLNAVRLWNGKIDVYQNSLGHTHNARPYIGGTLHNLAFESKTRYIRYDGKTTWEGKTPVPKVKRDVPEKIAQAGYVRGMVVDTPYIIVGTSPAAINVFTFMDSKPIKTIQISMDIRNSICGIAKCYG